MMIQYGHKKDDFIYCLGEKKKQNPPNIRISIHLYKAFPQIKEPSKCL